MSKLSKVQQKALIKGGLDHVISEMKEALSLILDCAEYIGQLTSLSRKEWPEAFETKMRDLGVMNVLLDACVRVANDEIDPRLVLMTENDKRYKYLVRLNKREQKKVLDKGVKVMVYGDRGDHTDLMVNINDITPEQAELCFTADGLRDLGAQRAYIESRRSRFKVEPDLNTRRQCYETPAEYVERLKDITVLDKASKGPKTIPKKTVIEKPEPPKPDWEIKDGKLVVNKPGMTFDQVKLIEILGKLASMAASRVA